MTGVKVRIKGIGSSRMWVCQWENFNAFLDSLFGPSEKIVFFYSLVVGEQTWYIQCSSTCQAYPPQSLGVSKDMAVSMN